MNLEQQNDVTQKCFDLQTNKQPSELLNENWVEDLFPPSFQLMLNKSVSNTVNTNSKSCKCPIEYGFDTVERSQKTGTECIFARLASKQISPLDIEAIKNVYQRVWIMMKSNEANGMYILHRQTYWWPIN